MYLYLERSDQGLAWCGDGELFKVKLGGFTQIPWQRLVKQGAHRS